MQKGVVIWLTGLPNCGKTTISKQVKKELKSSGYIVELLDSDEVPRSLTKDLSPHWETRQREKSTNLIYVAKLLSKHNVIVLISSVGRLRKMRELARTDIKDFIEVYLKCPLDTRLERDTNGKYKRYPSTIHYFEEPDRPEIVIETDKSSPVQAARKILDYLSARGYISVTGHEGSNIN
ncbi:adenylyl-sulfate kinase [Effusibacillus consociatus]|uniref:Adenylyl-sulfate kinase n=1 Tax=Effusibacillus consociatus TaxID=1117041 RepID=A0ABV9Q6E1_9BACL